MRLFPLRTQTHPMADNPDRDRVQDSAERRQSDRAGRVEDTVAHAADLLEEEKYPVTSEELAADYADEPIDLPNETESLGSVFDRLTDERFESVEEAREALYSELTGTAGGVAEHNPERDLDQLEEAAEDDVTGSGASDM